MGREHPAPFAEAYRDNRPDADAAAPDPGRGRSAIGLALGDDPMWSGRRLERREHGEGPGIDSREGTRPEGPTRRRAAAHLQAQRHPAPIPVASR